MREKFIAMMLKPFGLYKVNRAYLREESQQLKEIETSLSAAARVAEAGTLVIAALKSGDATKAAERFLKLSQADDQAGKTQAKVAGGAAVTEIVGATRAEITDRCHKIADLEIDITVVFDGLNRKILHFEEVAAKWPLGEKMGTPAEVRRTVKRAQEAQKSAEETEKKLTGLLNLIASIP